MKVHRLSATLALAVMAGVIASCGNPPVAKPFKPHTVATQAPTTSHASPADQIVALTTQMYPPGSDCAGVAATTFLASVSATCSGDWFRFFVKYVPGQADITNVPTTVSVAPGASVSQATTQAMLYVRTQAIEAWAATYHYPTVIQDISPNGNNNDPLSEALSQNYTLALYPTCMLPTALQAAHLSTAEIEYLAGDGWATVPAQVLIATFPACAGLSALQGNKPVTEFGRKNPESVLLDLVTEQVGAPLGTVVVVENQTQCGPSALAAACGSH